MHVAVGQGSGDYHLSVGIELLPETMPDVHPRKEKQIQRVGVGQTIEYWEVSLIYVTGGDLVYDQYRISMIAPDEDSTVIYAPTEGGLTLNATATEMQEALAAYYQDYYGVTPAVEKYFQDANGTVVTTEDFDSGAHTIVYNVTVSSPLGAAGTCT